MKKREIKGSFYNLIKINPNQKAINCFQLENLIKYKMDRNYSQMRIFIDYSYFFIIEHNYSRKINLEILYQIEPC